MSASGAHTPSASLSPATVVVGAGRPPRVPGAPVNVPIELSSTYAAWPAQGPELTPESTGYGRYDNGTWAAFEQVVGALESGRALCFASGMAAISAAVAALPAVGAFVVPRTPYNTSRALFLQLQAAGREIRWVDLDDTAATVAALDGATAAWLESPSNPLMQVADLPTLIAAARARGVVVGCDNTFATPLVQRPLELGADLVVHSATKYLSGHSDLLLGVVATASPSIAGSLLAHRTLHGAIAGPMEAWLALRGIRTLHVRFERASANATALAERLAGHPRVTRVRYPGFGAMLAIEVAGTGADAERTAAACRVWYAATSLGGVESLIERRRRYPGESHAVPDTLLRLSVGIEDVEDLWRDLDQALRA